MAGHYLYNAAMVLKRFFLIASGSLLISMLQPFWLNFPAMFGKSATVAQTTDARKAKANRLLQQGLKQAQTSQFKAALQSFQQALIIYQEIKDRQSEGVTLGSLGLAYLSLGKYADAIKYFQQVLVIAREVKDRQTEGKALGNLGLSYFFLGDYAKAIEYQQQLLAIAKETKDRKTEGQVMGHLGNAYRNLGDYTEAIEYQQQFLAIALEIKDRESEGSALGNFGAIYYYLGDYTKAIQYLEQHLAIIREIKDRQSEGAVLGNLGNVYLELGDYAKAIQNFQQILAIAKEIEDRQSEGAALGNLGLVYNNLGDYTGAIKYHEQWLAIAREIGDRQGEGIALGNLGLAYNKQGDYLKAIEYYKQWLAIAREIGDRRSESVALNNLGAAFYKSGNLPAASKTLFEGIKVLESLRDGLNDTNKVSIFETQTNTYKTLQQVLIAQNKIDASLEISESGRARAFIELLASRLAITDKREVKTPQPLKIEQIKQIAKAQNATFVQYSIINNDFKVQGKSEFKESQLYIWVVKPTGEVTFRKADLKSLWQKQNTNLAKLVTTTRDFIGVRGQFKKPELPVDEENPTKRLQQLHQLLIAPIADILPNDPNQRVIFVPQDELFLVPFAALQDSQGKYLIEKHTILTAPSIQVLELTRHQRERVKLASVNDTIVVGNPTMPSVAPKIGEKPEPLSPLPGAEREAQAIAPILNTKALTGNEATKATVLARLPQAKIIHLATHGLFDDFQGLQSAVALAPSGKDNGLLTAEQILDQKLNADLVILSACNTARGRITGDGVIGLSRSLISAGTPSVIVSLWSVPDAPTAQLMREFYTNLFQKKLDKAQALRQAMLKLKNEYPNTPKKWAAFTLIGEAQ